MHTPSALGQALFPGPPVSPTWGSSVILMRDAIWLPTRPPAARLPITWGLGRDAAQGGERGDSAAHASLVAGAANSRLPALHRPGSCASGQQRSRKRTQRSYSAPRGPTWA